MRFCFLLIAVVFLAGASQAQVLPPLLPPPPANQQTADHQKQLARAMQQTVTEMHNHTKGGIPSLDTRLAAALAVWNASTVNPCIKQAVADGVASKRSHLGTLLTQTDAAVLLIQSGIDAGDFQAGIPDWNEAYQIYVDAQGRAGDVWDENMENEGVMYEIEAMMNQMSVVLAMLPLNP